MKVFPMSYWVGYIRPNKPWQNSKKPCTKEYAVAHLEPSQISKAELFAKIVNGF